MKLVKAMATVAGLTGLSRIAGFVRDVFTAAILGAGPIADAFFVALKLPNFFRRVTAEGAFSVSFVPLYSKSLTQESREEADQFASNVFMVMLAGLGLFSLLAVWAMPFLIYGIAPGFTGDAERYDLAVELSRITFPYLLLISLTALLGGVMNALDRFAPFAFAPVLFNVSLIGFLLNADLFETAGHAMAWGIFAAGFFQFIWLFVCARRARFKLSIQMPRFDGRIKRVLALMGPGVIGAGVMQINLFADLIIASFLGTGSISYLFYADRLNQLPLGMVGIAVGAALLPMLSKALAAGKNQEASDLFNRAMEYCLLLALPAAFALAVIPEQLISVLFERGAFTGDDSLITSRVLMGYALGLPAYIAIKVFSTAHWAREDTSTPVKIAVIATLLNIALSLALIQPFGVAGIALATGLTAWLQFVMHWRALKDHPAIQFDARFIRALLKIVGASVIMSAALYGAVLFWDSLTQGQSVFEIIGLAGLVIGGAVVYGICVVVSGVIKPADIKALIKR